MTLRTVIRVLLFAAITLLFVACGVTSEGTETTSETGAPVATENELAPDFTLTTLDGNEITLSDYRGEWVLLNFWATWCPPCTAEMPYLQTLADRGLNVLGLNMAEEEGKVKLFTVRHGINFPILMEPYDNLVLDYQAQSLPRTVIIAPDGTVALRIAGPIGSEQLDRWLEAVGAL